MRTFRLAVRNFLVRHAANGMSRARLGEESLKDPSFVFQLLRDVKPREPREATVQKVQAFMDRYDMDRFNREVAAVAVRTPTKQNPSKQKPTKRPLRSRAAERRAAARRGEARA